MTREQVQHVIRATATIANERSLVVIDSQAVLLPYPDANPDLLVSRELDPYPAMAPDKFDLIEGTIGALSQFDETFGDCADGVSPDTAVMPPEWMRRASLHDLGDTTAACPDMHDLVVSKCVAGREKDARFVAVMQKEKMISLSTLEPPIQQLDPMDPIESLMASARRRAEEASA